MPYISILAINPATGKLDEEYTAKVLRERTTKTFRQCALEYHEECSDPAGDVCECGCHKEYPYGKEKHGNDQ